MRARAQQAAGAPQKEGLHFKCHRSIPLRTGLTHYLQVARRNKVTKVSLPTRLLHKNHVRTTPFPKKPSNIRVLPRNKSDHRRRQPAAYVKSRKFDFATHGNKGELNRKQK